MACGPEGGAGLDRPQVLVYTYLPRDFRGVNDVLRQRDERSTRDADVLVLCKGPLEALPPALSLLERLQPNVKTVHAVVGSARPETVSAVQRGNLKITCADAPGTKGRRGRLGKALAWLRYLRTVQRVLREEALRAAPLWVASGDTALCVAPILCGRRYVLQLNELYDTAPLYRRGLGPLARAARAVAVPEVGRAAIVRSWMNLQTTPRVIPNKPNEHPRKRRLGDLPPGASVVKEMVERGAKVALYQGHISAERDVARIAEAFSEIEEPWRLVLMGQASRYLDTLQARFPQIVHVPYVPAPRQLLVTSWAHVGIACYNPATLNNAFCAPNKIFEYSGFGIPIIGNNVPGLRYTVAAAGAGLCLDSFSGETVALALRDIDRAYERFSTAATVFFDGTDPVTATTDCLLSLFGSSQRGQER